VGLPPQSPLSDPSRHPFGRRAFRIGIIGCCASIVIGLLVTVLVRGEGRGAGIALAVIGTVCLLTVASLLVLERAALSRRPPPGPEDANGHRHDTADLFRDPRR